MTQPHTTLNDPWQLQGRTIGDRYQVVALIAKGGDGRVYKAVDAQTGRPVALKVITPDPRLEGEAMQIGEAFENERAVLARVEHPAIVRCLGHGVVDIGRQRKTVYLVLEWVDGVTLDKRLGARGAMPPGEALALLRPVLDALAASHEVGVAHRDLKPSNVMVEGPDDAPRLRLLDFGIAKLMRPDEALGEHTALTLSSNPAFSPAYAAPEQLAGAQTGPWTDVHAFALLLTEAIVGRPAYNATEFAALLREACSPERPTPARHGVDVGALEPVLARALALRPQGRYADARELREAIERAMSPAAPEAHDPPEAPPAHPSAGIPKEVFIGVGVGALLAVAAAALILR